MLFEFHPSNMFGLNANLVFFVRNAKYQEYDLMFLKEIGVYYRSQIRGLDHLA
jgi:hypothetical protein